MSQGFTQPVVVHNNTLQLQGGVAGQYYHLTAAQYAFYAGLVANQVLFGGPAGAPTQSANLVWQSTNGTLEVGAATSAAASTFILKGDRTIASAAGAVWDAFKLDTSTLTLTGTNTNTLLAFARINAPVFTQTGAGTSTTTDAATLYIAGAPTTDAEAPITNKWALMVPAGNVKIGGTLYFAETGGATLSVAAIADNYYLKRSGTTLTAVASIPISDVSGLTATYVAYGSGTNTITGEAAFNYNATTHVLNVGTGVDTTGVLTLGRSDVSIGATRSATGAATLNFVANTGSPAYNLKVTRAAGTDGVATITNSGAGDLVLAAEGTLSTNSATVIRFQNAGSATTMSVRGSGQYATVAGFVWDSIDVVASTCTLNGAGTVNSIHDVCINRPTITSPDAVTVTEAATFNIINAPLAAGSVTITNPWAIKVQNGDVGIVDRMQISANPTKASFSSLAQRLQVVGTYSTLASATGVLWRAFEVSAGTLTLSGTNTVTSLSSAVFVGGTITDASSVTVTTASTVLITNITVPAGSVTVTNAWGLAITPTAIASVGTIATAASLYISAAPSVTGGVITTPLSLYIASGNAKIQDTLTIGATTPTAYNILRVKTSATVAQALGADWDGLLMGVASTCTITGTGTITRLNQCYFSQPTLQSALAITVSTAANVRIDGAPTPFDANTTITTGWALDVTSGNVHIVDKLMVAGTGITSGYLATVSVGGTSATPTTTPLRLSLGATYSSAAGEHPKLAIYDGGTESGIYGLGASPNQLDFIVPTGKTFSFSVNAVEQLALSSTGFDLMLGGTRQVYVTTSAFTVSPAGTEKLQANTTGVTVNNGSQTAATEALSILCDATSNATGTGAPWWGIRVEGTWTQTGLPAGTITNGTMVNIARPVVNAANATTITTGAALRMNGILSPGTNVTVTNAYILALTPSSFASSATTITNAACLYISAAPSVTVGTITYAYSIFADAGIARIDGGIYVGNDPAIGQTTVINTTLVEIGRGATGATSTSVQFHAQADTGGTTIDYDAIITRSINQNGNFSIQNSGNADLYFRSGLDITGGTAGVTGSGITFNTGADYAGVVGADEKMRVEDASVCIGITSASANQLLRVQQTGRSVTAAAGSTWNAVNFLAHNIATTGNTNITTATGFNAHVFVAPTITIGGTSNITNSANVYIGGQPTKDGGSGGAGVITNAYALWVDTGISRFDGDGTHVFELPADATAGSTTITGRVPIKVGAATKYIHYHDS